MKSRRGFARAGVAAALLLCCSFVLASEMATEESQKPSLEEFQIEVLEPLVRDLTSPAIAAFPKANDACTVGVATCNSTKSDGLFSGDCTTSNGNYFDGYTIFLSAGTRITIAVDASGGLDPAVGLGTENGTVLAADDDSGTGLNALLSYTVATTGTYLIVVNSLINGDFGFYTMTITCTTGGTPPPSGGSCSSNSTTLCLNQNRFRVSVTWRAHDGSTGNGRVVPGASADSGLFWFFDQNNWEMLIKVINGCGLNSRYWLFGAATTDVQYTITVTDTKNGTTKTYNNPLGTRAAAITDTGAFATCP